VLGTERVTGCTLGRRFGLRLSGMHVAVVSPYSLSKPGGVQDHARELAKALHRMGHDVTLFGPELRGPQPGFDGIGTVSLGRAVNVPANGSIAPLGIDPTMLVRLDLALDAADVVHVHEPFLPVGLATLWRRPRNTAVVGTFHAAAERFAPYAIAAPLLRRAVKRLDETTAASPEARRLVRRYVAVDPEIVPNGVDVASFDKAEPDPWARDLGRVVLFVGRAEPRKGFDTVLRAFDAIAHARSDVHLVWIPATPDDVPNELRHERIHALGPVSHERKLALHRAAEIVLCASTGSESFGIVVLEGLAGGSAVLASDIPGYRYAGGEAPRYVTPGDTNAWIDALAHLLDDERERSALAARGPDRAALFDWDVVAEQTLHVYERALGS
jgi:phosphatidyl-myo-inositol alpha-mannosyltransferase